mgnify:FL=1|jgi:hypothetical protein|tara:strand:+ start:1926 stop:2444 length:519 start_codon:yes stop_codon:yes gene_type:complete
MTDIFDGRTNYKMSKKTKQNWNNPKAVADRKLGGETERYFLPRLNKWFNTKFDIDKTGWRVFDLLDKTNKIGVELKTRRCSSSRWNSTMIGNSKWKESRRLALKGYKTYLFIKFTDGIKFFQFPTMLKEGMYIQEAGCYSRGKADIKLHLFIPMDYFEDIKDYSSIIDYLEK